MLNRKKGFTLIELVIVIAVIAIVIGAALPRLSAYKAKQNELSRDKQEYVINKAIKQYYALSGRYPDYNDYLDKSKTPPVFDDELFAEDITKKTGAVIDAEAYIITYYDMDHRGSHGDKTPYTADVKTP